MSAFGLTSYAYYWACRPDACWGQRGAPMGPTDLVRQTVSLGLEVLQICENVAAFDPGDPGQTREVRRAAERAGIRLELGCRADSADDLRRSLAQAQSMGAELLRVVPTFGHSPQDPGAGPRLAHSIRHAMSDGWPDAVKIAIENYPGLTDTELAAIVEGLASDHVGVTLDTANSLGRLAPPIETARVLAPHALSVHLKDYVVTKPPIGFRVSGAPLGEGELDLAAVLDVIAGAHQDPPLLIELWVDPEPDPDTTLSKEADWVARSVARAKGQ